MLVLNYFNACAGGGIQTCCLCFPRRLLTDRYEWSDETGVLERRKEGYPLPSSDWQWCGEWKVDYNTTEGTDKEGWMYALDFPRYDGFLDGCLSW